MLQPFSQPWGGNELMIKHLKIKSQITVNLRGEYYYDWEYRMNIGPLDLFILSQKK